VRPRPATIRVPLFYLLVPVSDVMHVLADRGGGRWVHGGRWHRPGGHIRAHAPLGRRRGRCVGGGCESAGEVSRGARKDASGA
jgi:hypothetical protein